MPITRYQIETSEKLYAEAINKFGNYLRNVMNDDLFYLTSEMEGFAREFLEKNPEYSEVISPNNLVVVAAGKGVIKFHFRLGGSYYQL